MSNYQNYQQTSSTSNLGNKPKTLTIDPRNKEVYYLTSQTAMQESRETIQNRRVFWNYMMNVSMQNTIAQMAKIS